MKSIKSESTVKSFFQKRLNKLSYNERVLLNFVTDCHRDSKAINACMDDLLSLLFISPTRIKYVLNKLKSNNFIDVNKDYDENYEKVILIDLAHDYRTFLAYEAQGFTHENSGK